MQDRLAALKLFARVAHTGSFSSAAREAGLSQPSVSRIIATLEQGLGTKLLARTTRANQLTDAGRDYLARIEPILDALDEADHAARGSTELRGTLHVAVSSSFANRRLVPALPGFLARHPALQVDLRMSDSRQDLVRDGIDIALRFGPLADSRATARVLGGTARVLVASPAYLAEHGTPTHPGQLEQHALVVGPAGGGAVAWSFRQGHRHLSLRVSPRLQTTLNEAAIVGAVHGLGIASSGGWGCLTELADGRLKRLLPDWDMGVIELHALFPAARAARPAARALGDYLHQYLSAARADEDALIQRASVPPQTDA
ncbi:LysR family transcriptional regulator [Oleiagrimonas sp. C23AA]|uniref:LysR family transcriptional regulator n=1 Tax=Oleiagrimonas sp. C23AA TaxID=2719047 RepID=UPI00141E46FB|nr:LysR family transcriptional regulator [Oleiagrimonas sp. C23AA]NII09710.1 LysR family transcriptional regulator [Oleiagrimonas sp. C23AA]